jgi:hypothetical protein
MVVMALVLTVAYQVETELQRPQSRDGDQQDQVSADIAQPRAGHICGRIEILLLKVANKVRG